ncbi:MAG: hypothetical protein ACXW5U_31640 [Thermoanaerobaculia bacterium]
MDEKDDLLKRYGYRYNFDRMVYINRVAKKVFSVEAIEDHPTEWLADRLAESTNGEWRFYFNEVPSPAVVRDFLVQFGEHRAAS